MTVDQKAQVANAREEQQMSNENDERNSAEVAGKLSEDDREFLLGIVDNPHSDYDEEIEGWANFTVKDDHLVVQYQDEDGEVTKGRWHLTFVGGSVKAKGQGDD